MLHSNGTPTLGQGSLLIPAIKTGLTGAPPLRVTGVTFTKMAGLEMDLIRVSVRVFALALIAEKTRRFEDLGSTCKCCWWEGIGLGEVGLEV